MSGYRNKTLVMGAIPGTIRRGRRVRQDLTYVPYARASWAWWCRKRDVKMVVIEQPVEGPLGLAPPPTQRWQVARDLLRAPGVGQVAVVDADTMVRWDTPDFFDLAGDALGAVRVKMSNWLKNSLAAYGVCFPGLTLDGETCFNSGLVILNQRHVAMLDDLVQFFIGFQPELEALQSRWDVGVDQTLLNYFAARSGAEVRLLNPAFNKRPCFKLPRELHVRHEHGTAPIEEIEAYLPGAPGFDFIEDAYVWHFTKTIRTRAAVMREVWRRVQHRYPEAGALNQ